MMYKITYINQNGYKTSHYFNVLAFDELLKFIRKNPDRFCEVLEIKCVVRDFVEAISYTDATKSC